MYIMNSHLILIATSCEQAYVWEGHGDAAEVPPDSSLQIYSRALMKRWAWSQAIV